MFNNRTYRKHHRKKGLVSFDITVKETNLNIQADENLSEKAKQATLSCRNYIENYISLIPEFETSLVPLKESGPAPKIIRQMIFAGQKAGVGPMAAVAGAVSQAVGTALLEYSSQIVVENGGDIFIHSNTDTVFGIYAQDSPFYKTAGIQVAKKDHPYGICTSSGTLGHSKSFGKADAATVMAHSCPTADAVATALGNKVQKAQDIKAAIDWASSIDGVQGIVILKGEHIGLWGDLKIIKLNN